MLRRRKWLIMLVTASALRPQRCWACSERRNYTAKAAVMIDPRQLQVTNIEQVMQGMSLTAATIATQIGLLQSRRLHRRGHGRSHLFDDPEFNPALTGGAGDDATVAARAFCSRSISC